MMESGWTRNLRTGPPAVLAYVDDIHESANFFRDRGASQYGQVPDGPALASLGDARRFMLVLD